MTYDEIAQVTGAPLGLVKSRLRHAKKGTLTITPFDEMPKLMDLENQRPREQWWRQLAPIAQLLAAPASNAP